MMKTIDETTTDITDTFTALASKVLVALIQPYLLTFHVFLRRSIGERQCQPFHVFGGLMLISAYSAMINLVNPFEFGKEGNSWTSLALSVAYNLLFIVLGLKQALPHWKRLWGTTFIEHHSRSFGVPRIGKLVHRLRPKFPPHMIPILVEPALMFIVGATLFLGFRNITLGIWFINGAVVLSCVEWIRHSMWRDRILTIVDQKIEGTSTAHTLRHVLPMGSAFPTLPTFAAVEAAFANSDGKPVSYDDMVKNLDPELRDLMKPTEQPAYRAAATA